MVPFGSQYQDEPSGVFGIIVSHPIKIALVAFVLIAATAVGLPQITKNTSADGFLDPDSSALLYKERVETLFGLEDPIVIGVVSENEGGALSAEALMLTSQISELARSTPNVDPDQVTSVATESYVTGDGSGMLVQDFLEPDGAIFRSDPTSRQRAEEVLEAIADFPLYQGSLVGDDGRASLIVVELIDASLADETYEQLIESISDLEAPAGLSVHVAGEGAVAGSLSGYIDRDAARLNPLAGVVITAILVLAFLSLRGAVIPNVIVLGSVAGSLGLMGCLGVDFFVITNGLVVNLIGIAVADSIHVFNAFFNHKSTDPSAARKVLIHRAMRDMARPITLTSITTIAGFLALALASSMPPIRYFGLFGALGVAFAWLYSMTLLPALLAIWPLGKTPLPFKRADAGSGGAGAGLMLLLGRGVLSAPRTTLALGGLMIAVGVAGALQLRVDDARIENFRSDEPIHVADTLINQYTDGTHYLDILIDTGEAEGLFEPALLERIEALEAFLVSLDHVNGVTSLTDYVKQMNKAVREGDPAAYRIPDDSSLISQLFLLYTASADPSDFEEEADTEFRRALVRARLDTGRYSVIEEVVPAVDAYVAEHFADLPEAVVTGRTNVDYHWLATIEASHFRGVGLALLAVMVMAAIVFRSALAGLFAGAPVIISVLIIYAAMGFGGIWLGIGTSMFAAIAIGLGVDFAIHTLDRIREIVRSSGFDADALATLYPDTGRALLFNFLAVALGFGVLLTSTVPPLVKFGALVAIAVSAAFMAAMTILPCAVLLIKPRFLTR